MNAVADWQLLGPPFLAGLLILVTHVPLGRIVLARGIVFLDLAVAQIAGLGVIAAHFAGIEADWAVQAFAVAAAISGALMLNWAERRWPKTQEALIGSTFAVAASAGILLLAHDPHGGEALHGLLAGQILWVNGARLAAAAAVTAVLAGLLASPWGRGGLGFYLSFACAVTLSVQLAGVYLVFASLIMPALAVHRQAGARALAAGWAVGAAGYATGLLASARFDLPAGAAVVCALALAALLFSFVRSRRFRAGKERLGLK